MRKLLLILLVLCLCAGLPALAEEEGDGHYPGDNPEMIETEVNNTSGTVPGVDVSAADRNVTGVLVNADQGEAIEVTVEGAVTVGAETTYNDHQACTAVSVNASGEGSGAAVTVDGNISAVNTWTDNDPMNLDDSGLSAWAGDGGTVSVTVNGDVFSKAEILPDDDEGYTWSGGVGAYTSAGSVAVTVNGNVTAEADQYAVGLNVNNEIPGGNVSVEVHGDVTAKSIGIRAINDSEESSAEIVVDGTLHASKNGISLEGNAAENVLLTVWKAEPNQNGVIVMTDGDLTAEEAEQAEKNIRYILRTAESSAGQITADAAEYRGYRVAKEGETVALDISIPNQYRIGSVYGQPGKKMELQADEAGNYYLVVPRGGEVELSVELKRKQAKNPFLREARDTAQTAEIKGALQSADGVDAALPEDILTQLTRDEAAEPELKTLSLYYPCAGKASADASCPLQAGRTFAEGEEAAVILAVPEDGGAGWYVLEGTGLADGRLQITLTPELIRLLAGRAFLAVIL